MKVLRCGNRTVGLHQHESVQLCSPLEPFSLSLPIFTNWVRSKPLSNEAAVSSGLNLGHISPQMRGRFSWEHIRYDRRSPDRFLSHTGRNRSELRLVLRITVFFATNGLAVQPRTLGEEFKSFKCLIRLNVHQQLNFGSKDVKRSVLDENIRLSSI